jgi:hypothetical protein
VCFPLDLYRSYLLGLCSVLSTLFMPANLSYGITNFSLEPDPNIFDSIVYSYDPKAAHTDDSGVIEKGDLA